MKSETHETGKIMLKMVGSSGQLSLGKKYAGKYFQVEHLKGGAVLLRPMKVVPDAEAWVHEPAPRAQLRRADEWAKRTPPAATDLARLVKKAGNAAVHPPSSRVMRGFKKPSSRRSIP
jgi:hypothetical protein